MPFTCRGCGGTCCTGVGSDPCTCSDTFIPQTAADVTDEMVEMALNIVDGWYQDRRIDWENVWDRMEDSELKDGRFFDPGADLLSPALAKIQREVRKALRNA